MRILILGSGGREHALAWKLLQSPLVDEVYVAPGNAGTEFEGAINVPIRPDSLSILIDFAIKHQIDLVVPGQERALTVGIADSLNKVGIPCFGPDGYAAQLEGSKSFAKEMMTKTKVPTADYKVFDDPEVAKAYLRGVGRGMVIKADGLATGKGVFVTNDAEEGIEAIDKIMVERQFGNSGKKVVIEEKLAGEEVSLLCICSGEVALPLLSAQDHKAVFDGDTGPNTGGMGAYCPAPILMPEDSEKMVDLAIRPILKNLVEAGHPYLGILYAGLMLTPDGPKVLEYNVRFGDPECQPLLMLLENDLVDVMQKAIKGELSSVQLTHKSGSALGVVMCANGYPASYEKGMLINGIGEAEKTGAKVFQAGTEYKRGNFIASGGRILCVTASGENLQSAQENAYNALQYVQIPNSFYRKDIGAKGLKRLNQK